MSSASDEYKKTIAALQAEAWAALERDMAEAEAARARARDPLRNDRIAFLLLLINVRLAKKLSQAQLAARLGKPQSVIARIESGRGNPGLNTLLAMAKALGVRLVVE